MSAVIQNAQKILRHHIPLIRFKYGANQSDSTVRMSNEKKTTDTTTTTTTTSSKVGTKTTPLEFSQTPTKYRRRPLTQDEIDLVTVGGFT